MAFRHLYYVSDGSLWYTVDDCVMGYRILIENWNKLYETMMFRLSKV